MKKSIKFAVLACFLNAFSALASETKKVGRSPIESALGEALRAFSWDVVGVVAGYNDPLDRFSSVTMGKAKYQFGSHIENRFKITFHAHRAPDHEKIDGSLTKLTEELAAGGHGSVARYFTFNPTTETLSPGGLTEQKIQLGMVAIFGIDWYITTDLTLQEIFASQAYLTWKEEITTISPYLRWLVDQEEARIAPEPSKNL